MKINSPEKRFNNKNESFWQFQCLKANYFSVYRFLMLYIQGYLYIVIRTFCEMGHRKNKCSHANLKDNARKSGALKAS